MENLTSFPLSSGKVRKLKNHLTEFGTTSAMIVHDSFLISSGYDLDKGTGYLNGREINILTVSVFINCLI